MPIAKRGRLMATIAAVAVLGLTACSGGTSTTGAASPTAGAAPSSITISYPASHQSFDPTKTVTAIDGALFGQIGGHLTTLTLDGEIENQLAQTIDMSPDFTSATVTLKPGLKFSDGTDLTPADVAATFTRNMGVEGSTMGSLTNAFAGVEAAGDTVVFTFKDPFPSFPSAMAADGAMIFPASGLAKGESFFDQPVSAGKYTLNGGWASNKVDMTVNPHYVDGKAAYEKVTVQSLADSNAVVSQMKAGQIQFSADLPPSYLEQFAGSNVTTSFAPGFGFYNLRLNNRVAPFDDANVRNAIHKGIDRDAIIQQVWKGGNDALGGFWPRTLSGYDPALNTPRDVAGAKELLKGTACENGCEIELMYAEADFPFANQLVLLVQSQLKDIGITIKLDSVDQPTLIERLVAGNFTMAPGANNSGGAFPDKLINDALLSTSGIKAEFTGYNSPEMDALVKEVVTTDGAARQEAEKKVNALFAKDRPFVTYATRVRGQASSLPADTIAIVGSSLVIATSK